MARILINGYTSKIRVTPRATLSSNDRSPIRFGKNKLKTGGYPQKPRKSVGIGETIGLGPTLINTALGGKKTPAIEFMPKHAIRRVLWGFPSI